MFRRLGPIDNFRNSNGRFSIQRCLIKHAFGGYYNCSFLYVLVEICCIGYELKARRQFSPDRSQPHTQGTGSTATFEARQINA